MYFVKRGGAYHDVAGASFRDLLDGGLPQLPGERATLSDWKNHLTTIFPEVRLKNYLEMRGADAGPWRRLCALPALWVGLLYDETSLDAAWELVKDWSAEERQALRDEVPRTALATRFRNRTVQEVARDVVGLARDGLQRRARLGWSGPDETPFLGPVEEVAESGMTAADRLLEDYEGRWNRSVEPLFREYAY
jgi:glutamate--cysteine ligase